MLSKKNIQIEKADEETKEVKVEYRENHSELLKILNEVKVLSEGDKKTLVDKCIKQGIDIDSRKSFGIVFSEYIKSLINGYNFILQ